MREREYVIVCNEHKAIFNGVLLFWGNRTQDDAERSYGGYTCDLDKCERYTREELEKWRTPHEKEYPFLEEITKPFNKNDEVLITIKELEKIGYRKFKVMGK